MVANDVAVALHPRHPCRVSRRASQSWESRALARGPLPDEDLRPVAVRLVVVVNVVEELHRSLVVVVVNHIRRRAFYRRRRNQLQLRILLLDCLVELRSALIVAPGLIKPVLVPNLHKVHRNASGCPSFARSAPHFVFVSPLTYYFNFFQRVLHIRLKVGSWIHVLALQRIARIHGKRRLEIKSSHHSRNSSSPRPSEE